MEVDSNGRACPAPISLVHGSGRYSWGLPPMLLEMSSFGGCSDPEKKRTIGVPMEETISISI